MVVVTIVVLALTGSAAAWYAFAFVYGIAVELDRSSELAELTPQPQSTIVYDREGKPAFTFFVEQRIEIPLDRVSPKMVDAILAVEDQRFYSHHGLDPIRIAAAARNNFRARRTVEGGSTITQQLARTSYGLSPRRTFDRKIREAMIASRLEQRYSKKDILEAYLNAVYFGEGFYGVEAASRGYFGKPALDLEAHEAALLAAIVRSPSNYAPCTSPKKAVARRDLVLRLMLEQGRLSAEGFSAAVARPIPNGLHRPAQSPALTATTTSTGQYFEEELRRQLVARFGNDRVLRGGLRVHSTTTEGCSVSPNNPYERVSRSLRRDEKQRIFREAWLRWIHSLVMLWRWSAGVTSARAASIARRRPGDKQGPHSNRSSMRQHSNAVTPRGRC